MVVVLGSKMIPVFYLFYEATLPPQTHYINFGWRFHAFFTHSHFKNFKKIVNDNNKSF